MATFDRKAYNKAYYEKNKDKIKLQNKCEHGRQKNSAKNVVVVKYASTVDKKHFVKNVAVVKYANTGKRRDIVKNVAVVKYASTEE